MSQIQRYRVSCAGFKDDLYRKYANDTLSGPTNETLNALIKLRTNQQLHQPKRYSLMSSMEGYTEIATGEWVLYSDYAAEVATKDAEIERLKAPVSDEELTPHCLGKKYFLTEVFDKVLASRSTQPLPQENGK